MTGLEHLKKYKIIMPRKANPRKNTKSKTTRTSDYDSENELLESSPSEFNDYSNTGNVQDTENNNEEEDEFVQENIDDFEEIYTITNKMKELLQEIKELKIQRKDLENKLLNEIIDSGSEEGVFKYKNIKLEYSVKKMINVIPNKKSKN